MTTTILVEAVIPMWMKTFQILRVWKIYLSRNPSKATTNCYFFKLITYQSCFLSVSEQSPVPVMIVILITAKLIFLEKEALANQSILSHLYAFF